MHDADTYDCSSSKRELVRDLVENIKHLKKMALDSENVKLLFRVKNVLFQIGETHMVYLSHLVLTSAQEFYNVLGCYCNCM